LVIYAGNQRLKAAKKLGLTVVPVCVMNLSDEKMTEIMIRDNVNNGEWDLNMLAEYDVNDLIEYGINFTDGALDTLTEHDDTDELPATKDKKTKVKKTIICEHCGHEIIL
jgi:ParB-like chromosome segregation protein Spo0J